LSMKVFAMKVEGRMEHEELEENLKKYWGQRDKVRNAGREE
jgi:hypothetical protein